MVTANARPSVTGRRVVAVALAVALLAAPGWVPAAGATDPGDAPHTGDPDDEDAVVGNPGPFVATALDVGLTA